MIKLPKRLSSSGAPVAYSSVLEDLMLNKEAWAIATKEYVTTRVQNSLKSSMFLSLFLKNGCELRR